MACGPRLWHDAHVSPARLTRREVGWLLAQEARGAASALRKGVTQRAAPDVDIQIREEPGLTSTLNVLDDAINLWSELEHGAPTRGRRGRIDIAALLCEIAPEARISIEPGPGTEVFGEESDLRRLLHLFVAHRGGTAGREVTAGEVEVRRQDEWIQVRVELGPDWTVSDGLERRWMSRMAMRLGGRIELVGSTEILSLPADSDSDHVEVENLRKELQEAQELGESYARELAAVFAEVQGRSQEADRAGSKTEGLDVLRGVAALTARGLRPIFGSLRDSARNARRNRDDETLASTLATTADQGFELLTDLEHVAELRVDEPRRATPLERVIEEALAAAEPRARRRSVTIDVRAEPTSAHVGAKALGRLMRFMLDHAIAATPAGGTVGLSVAVSGQELEIAVDDAGPPVPTSAVADLLSHRVEPTSLGRPGTIALLVVTTAVDAWGGTIRLDESPERRTRLTASLPLPAP
jgi:two-component system, OmpR family, sensor kinase